MWRRSPASAPADVASKRSPASAWRCSRSTGRRRLLGASSPRGASLLTLLGLTQTVAFALDDDEFGAVEQTVDEGDDAGRIREDGRPLGEGLVRGEHDRLALLVPAR